MTTVDTGELLGLARRLCSNPPADLEGRWPRAVALLARQSLEIAIDDYWAKRAAGVGQSRAWRPKLLCFDAYLVDPDLGHEAQQLWGTLSRACHVHVYELDPTVDELQSWIDAVLNLQARLRDAA